MDELLSEFLTESFENITVLDVELVRLEQNPNDPELLGGIFRIVHTIKGTCGFLGLPRLEKVAHAGENVLGRIRDGEIAVTSEAVTLVLEALDRIKSILGELERTEAEPPGDDADLIANLNRIAAGESAVAVSDADESATSESEVAADGESPQAPPTSEGSEPETTPVVPEAEPMAEAKTEPAAPPSTEPAKAAPTPTAAAHVPGDGQPTPSVTQQSLRVSVDLLEDLMTLVSELVLTRNQLLQMVRHDGESRFTAPLQRLSHITSELQEGVMKTRMQPIGNAWAKLPRLIRDLSVDLDKRIDLKMVGEDTELDRQVLELIKDPLTHMVRNSADHGIESPETRKAAGKPEHGTILLDAHHEGGQIIIEISDDGRGLDVQKLGAKAVERGVVDAAGLAALTPQQIMQFVFDAGFSTAEKVTSVSGRGVGMDVVRTNIEKIGGHVDLTSEAGKGTRFTIKIPLTLAIVAALIVEAGGERFAIPQIGVVELVRAGANCEHRIEVIDDAPILRLRDELLPLVCLAGQLGIGQDELDHFEQAYVVVAQVGANRVGLIVDRVFDTEEIVVKPVSPILKDVGSYSGNTILGDGSVVMIFDLNSLASSIVPAHRDENAATVAAQLSHGESTSVLLFRANDATPRAVPLGLVTRLEEIDFADVEYACGGAVVQYRGALMPLTDIDGARQLAGSGRRPTLVFTDNGHNLGLMVDEIIDIADDIVDVEVNSVAVGTIGSAVIGAKSTDILDVAHFVQTVFGGWFADQETEPFKDDEPQDRRILIVDDSSFFRNLLGPILTGNGYQVVKADSAVQALQYRDRGEVFDAIVSDIEMPEMDGFTFAERARDGGAWQQTPMIALTSHTTPEDIARGRAAGFDNHVGKLERESLLRTIQQTLELGEVRA
ncbi:MAG: hybrid sensor histidine kinase/response regulator [Pseudomonadota bacterium]